MPHSPAALSDPGDLWGSNDGDEAQDEDPTVSILNLSPDNDDDDDDPSPAITTSFSPSTFRRHPPAFQGAFSQARIQQPMMRSYNDAFSRTLPSLFSSPPALPPEGVGEDADPISPLASERDFGGLNSTALSAPGTQNAYPKAFSQAAARFLEDFGADLPVSPIHPAPSIDGSVQAMLDPDCGPSHYNLKDAVTDSMEEVLARLTRSLNESPGEAPGSDFWLPQAPPPTDSGPPSSSTAQVSATAPVRPSAPETDTPSASSSNRRPPTQALTPSSLTFVNPIPAKSPSNSSKRKNKGLFLPTRATRLADDERYSRTPFNSPITSGTSSPVGTYQPLIHVSRPPHPNHLQGKTSQAGMLASSRKRKATKPPPQPMATVADRRLSTIHDTLMQASAGNSRTSTSERRVVSGLPRRAELDQVRLLKQIRDLRQSGGPSATIERLEREWEALLRRSDGVEAAVELKRKATEHCLNLRRMKDALGGELVRVQIEESILRHVRGIIAGRRNRFEIA